MRITSEQNSRIKLVKRLRGKRGRQREGRFLIDYERDLQRALEQGCQIDFVLHHGDFHGLASCPDVEAHQVSTALLKLISYRENPEGFVAVMVSRRVRELADLLEAEIQHALALVELAVPGNIGALLRTADAAGMGAVILVDTAVDIYNPNVIRSSAGACFRDNIYQSTSSDLFTLLRERENECQIIAADPAGKHTLYEIDLRGMTLIALGSEAQGLPRDWLEARRPNRAHTDDGRRKRFPQRVGQRRVADVRNASAESRIQPQRLIRALREHPWTTSSASFRNSNHRSAN